MAKTQNKQTRCIKKWIIAAKNLFIFSGKANNDVPTFKFILLANLQS